ncbi:hypothetical protein LAZ40_09795 [Cereibacter sphaeroides]|uniref:hypothetical protein n=1 Tax=Cereibacter sphaeroides TaxID=1063 RepID=UPI001F34DBEF|nr:hypothetical protein [Cereibacter sphaeroides]MCE6959343.1 hypothetical protein [Cereibacter sphaeroides]MCE6972935.1 hypothetical protein [Cereibacter sphaeroides]
MKTTGKALIVIGTADVLVLLFLFLERLLAGMARGGDLPPWMITHVLAMLLLSNCATLFLGMLFDAGFLIAGLLRPARPRRDGLSF